MGLVIGVKLVHPKALIPKRQTKGASGYDLCSCERVSIEREKTESVRLGICVELPEGIEMQIRPRSGLSFCHRVHCLNSPGTIDSDFRGEIMVLLWNHGERRFVVRPGMRVAQAVFSAVPVIEVREVDVLSQTGRGAGGFGSTGL